MALFVGANVILNKCIKCIGVLALWFGVIKGNWLCQSGEVRNLKMKNINMH